MNNNFGQIISSRRKSLKLTQEKLADMIERSPGLIGQIERGETNPSYETLCRLKDVLQFDLDDAIRWMLPVNSQLSLRSAI